MQTEIMQHNVNLLPHQMKFLRSKKKFVWLKAGLGAGKTFALAWYVITRMLDNPETMGLIAANSYDQLNKSILNELFKQLDTLKLSYNYNTLSKTLTLHATGAVASVISLEKYDSLRGIEFGWVAIDELAYTREEAYNVVLGRLRCKNSKALELRASSTPNGFNFLYDRFGSGGYISYKATPDLHKDNYHQLISATAYDNFHLPNGYIDSLIAQYDPLLMQQEVLGEFINTQQGKVYWAFDRDKNLFFSKNPPIRLVAGLDFNVNPMTAVIGNILSKESVHAVGERWLENSNTYEMRDELLKIQHLQELSPDAAGGARKTSAVKSDHQILREAGFTLLNQKANPLRKDRINNVNRFLSKGWLTIDPKNIKLIEDIEKHVHDEDDPSRGHITDALGYMLWAINPIRKSIPKPMVKEIS